jgi:hypothetical protein
MVIKTPDKRQIPRVQPFVVPCRVSEGEQRWSGYVTDMSARGAQVSLQHDAPRIGARVVLELRVRLPRTPVTLAGQVKWQRRSPTACIFGITFEEVPEVERQALADALEDFRRLAEELSLND